MYIRVVSVQKLKILETKMKKGDWVVNYHADYCGHCQRMKPEWERFVNKMKKNRNINIADIESKMIPQMKEQPKIMGFPTIKYYHNNMDVADHDGDRTCDGFEQFTKKNINNNVARPVPKKQYPTIGDTLGDVNSDSGPMNDILKLFSDKLNGNKALKPSPVKVKKTKKAKKPTLAKAKKTKKAATSKAKKTKKSTTSKAKKSNAKKTKKTKKAPTKPKKQQPKIKPIKPVLKNKDRKTTTEREVKLHTNVQIIKTPQQIKAERKREKRKQQRTKKREQQTQQGKPPGRQNKIIKNLKESIADIKNQAAKDKKLLNELSR